MRAIERRRDCNQNLFVCFITLYVFYGYLSIYTQAVDYWANTEATYDGVLGGFGTLSSPDVRDSKAFIEQVREERGWRKDT